MKNPHPWKTKPLKDLFNLINGFSFASDDWSESGLPIIRIQNLNNKSAPYNFFEGEYSSQYLVNNGDLLFSWSGSRGTSFGPFFWRENLGLLNQHIFNLKRINHEITNEFAFLWLRFIIKEIEDQAHGSAGLVHITKSELGQFEIPVPEKSQQQKIALILTTVDNLIEKTQALIDKYTAIKQGMMADLFTRGIDLSGTPETNPTYGQLRPPVEQAPELYKQTELGWIPKDWEVRTLSDSVSSDITYGIVQAGPHIEGGVPYIRTGDMSGDDLIRDQMLCTTEEISNSYKRSEVKTGDIVCAIRATVGKVLMVKEDLNGANLTQGTARISPSSEIEGKYLYYTLKSDHVYKQYAEVIKGTTFMEITLQKLRKIKVPACALEEQKKISKKLKMIDCLVSEERKTLSKHQLVKKGLMQDLLTGRVQV